ncbi:heme lyase CcmF/NrfE family subunit [Aquibacillus sp. 3ASR75-11]|uniref:Heme lyase CcmF/NrfE family subunit n=1 Tax=Terrihalobacillus insolitus TaxID=2950438 RepID=A0A9X3WX20_9BACI|nr:heme lyase CcmF/NrfE family subunit [Terrihalobacillus insolitus]MDC3414547.1 heme lyase CcmF/NrfE family subunit [Terrihalobacillus insolitus]MDC3425776.1 heme lyase CcmF/NrfE family subunit [Terrihalobacillus insolitus]
MGEIGRWSIIFALVIISYGIVAHLIAIRTKSSKWLISAKRSVLALAGLTTLAAGSLIYLLVTSNFDYAYVAQYSSSEMALFYKISAFWGGNAGSLLLWLWILSMYTALVTWSKHKDSNQYLPWVSTFLLVINLFFALVLNIVEFPFALNPEEMNEGNGLNPLLQNPGMAVHPVTLYLGYIGFSIPFAYGMAALILKKVDATWLKITRRWTLVSWLFLSMGIIFGSQWAYVELGWGGYWAWDPVENASFLPWLTGTAFLHSAMIQERKGMMKKWNVSLVATTFMLTIFGTLLTRSGVLWSVHAFANGPIGAYFLGFIGFILVFSLWIISSRWTILEADVQFESAVSKESSFLVNNLLLVVSAFTIFLGTVYPVISEAVTGSKVMVGAPYFNRVNVPIFIALILAMGIGPVLAWKRSSLSVLRKNLIMPIVVAVIVAVALFTIGVGNWKAILAITSALFVLMMILLEFSKGVQARVKSTGESPFRSFIMLFVKNRRRYGGYIVHLAVVFVVIGLTGASVFSVDLQQNITKGETISYGKYSLEYRGLGETSTDLKTSVFAEFYVEKNGKELGVIRPEKVDYLNGTQTTTEVAVVSSVQEDLFVALNGWDEENGNAIIQVKIFPLITWVWFGGYLLILGTLIALWPERSRRAREIRRLKMESITNGSNI